jgi:hypothetical protein
VIVYMFCYFFFVLQLFSWHVLFYHFSLRIHITNCYLYFS